MIRQFSPYALVLCVMSMAGCGTSPVKYYPDFPTKKESLGDIVLLHDVFLLETTTTDTALLVVEWNRRMGDSLIMHASGALEKKGYPQKRSMVASIGMPVSPRNVYSVAFTAEEEDLPVSQLPKLAPPYHVTAELDTSFDGKREWQGVCRSLVHSTFTPEASHTIIMDAVEFGKRIQASTVIVMFASGITVPVGERRREKDHSPNVPIGQTAEERVSQSTVTFYILDTASGELIWSDQSSLTGGTVYVGKLYLLIDRILDRLP